MEQAHEHCDRLTAPRRDTDGLLQGARVLIVEDEAIIAMELQSTFEEEGADVVGPAFTLRRGMELAAKEGISAAVLDLRLGSDPVAPIARALAARHIPFLFYSGQPPNDPIRAEWPDTRTIAKPASGACLVDAVMVLLEGDETPARRTMLG